MLATKIALVMDQIGKVILNVNLVFQKIRFPMIDLLLQIYEIHRELTSSKSFITYQSISFIFIKICILLSQASYQNQAFAWWNPRHDH